jgi:pimeloyl-ACP methyl ester carboxylesterase
MEETMTAIAKRGPKNLWPLAVAAAVLALGAGASHGATTQAAKRDPKPSILLVHGAFADGSTWGSVASRLLRDGYPVVVSQIPLTSLQDDVAAVQRDLRVLGGPTVVVGHSYGGFVITQATEGAPNVRALVYVAADAPDTGETAADFNKLAPPLPSGNDFVPIDLPHTGQNGAPYVIIARDRFRADFCQDCPPRLGQLLAASEVPANASSFGIPLSGTPAWRQFPAWYQISSKDRIINPAAQQVMAHRLDPSGAQTITIKSGHASLITHSQQVARFIERAAGS